MKLVKIEDVRVGQVRKAAEEFVIVDSFYSEDEIQLSIYSLLGEEIDLDLNEYEGMVDCDTLKFDYTLIGFLGITHEIKDNKLVEIPRNNLEVDDVVKDNFNHFSHVINREIFDHSINKLWPDEKCFEAINETYGSRDFASFELNKIGIYGVTHEFVNERLVRLVQRNQRLGMFEVKDELDIELLSSRIHAIWSNWFLHQRAFSTPENLERWNKQAHTRFEDLSDEDKEKDRRIVKNLLFEILK